MVECQALLSRNFASVPYMHALANKRNQCWQCSPTCCQGLVYVVMQTKAKRYGGATHGFIHLGSLAEIRCSVRALEDVAIAMRQVVKEEKEPWDLRSYLMVVAVVVAFLSVKVWHYYKTGIAV